MLDRRQRREQLLQRVPAIEVPAAVAVPVHREQHASARSARIGRSRCWRRSPASSSTRSRRSTHRRAPPRPPPRCSADRRRPGRPGRLRGCAGRPRCLATSSRSCARVSSASGRSSEAWRIATVVSARPEDVLGEVEPGAGEPLRAGHRARAEHALVRARREHVEPLPDRRPEASRSVVDHSHRAA